MSHNQEPMSINSNARDYGLVIWIDNIQGELAVLYDSLPFSDVYHGVHAFSKFKTVDLVVHIYSAHTILNQLGGRISVMGKLDTL